MACDHILRFLDSDPSSRVSKRFLTCTEDTFIRGPLRLCADPPLVIAALAIIGAGSIRSLRDRFNASWTKFHRTFTTEKRAMHDHRGLHETAGCAARPPHPSDASDYSRSPRSPSASSHAAAYAVRSVCSSAHFGKRAGNGYPPCA